MVIRLTRPELKFVRVISSSFNKSILKEQLKFCGTNRRRAPDVTVSIKSLDGPEKQHEVSLSLKEQHECPAT